MKYLIFIITFLLSSVAFTQTQWVVFDSINAPLQTNLIKGIKTDSYGNVWFGTNNGLYKYDGLFWKNYNTNNSQIPYNQINNFFLDRNDNVWFLVDASPYPYLVKFDGVNWENIDTNQTCFPNNSYLIQNFVIDSYETKWVHTNSNIIRYDGLSCIYYDQQSIGINTTGVASLEIDHNDNFLFISQQYGFSDYGGIAKTTLTGWLFNRFSGYNFGTPVDFTVDTNNNVIWISFVLNQQPFDFVKVNYDSLQVINSYEYYDPGISGMRYSNNLISDLNGNVWQSFIISPDSDDDLYMGFLCFVSSSEEWLLFDENNSPLPSNFIYGISVDYYNTKWVATDNGLAVYNELGVVFPEQLTLIDTLNYGEVNIGESSSEELTIYNPTGINLIIDSLNFTNYVFSSNAKLPIDITANDSATIIINFQPVTVENYLSRLTLYTNNGMYAQVVAGVGKSPSGVFIEDPLFSFSLSQNYPNPFNPVTTINYQIPERGFVTLKVYDVLGNEVATLTNEEKLAGSYKIELNAPDLPSGIYFYRLRTSSFVQTKKMILLK